ncbi:MAG: hypothetical protein LBV23_00125 [Deltaproteobacteria bacterium]|jgi:hypothetical protein|nr:hypothetical protein [Deltaproteobacteria bacterium]
MTKFLRNTLPMFLLSLVLSFFFWLTVSGQDMNTHDLAVALELINIPVNLSLDDNIPETVTVRVEANTAQFRYLEGRKFFLRVDASKITGGLNYINFVDISKLINPTLPRGVKVNRVIPDEIEFEAHPFETKKLPVQITVYGQLRNYLEMSGPMVIEPATAELTGPANRLKDFDVLPTTSLNLGDVTGPGGGITLSPQLPGLETWLTVKPNQFKVYLDVSVKREELSFEVPIVLNDFNAKIHDEKRFVIRPEKVWVTVSWPLNMHAPSSGSTGGLTAEVNLEGELLNRASGSARLLVQVTSPAKGVDIIKVNPERVTISWEPIPSSGASPINQSRSENLSNDSQSGSSALEGPPPAGNYPMSPSQTSTATPTTPNSPPAAQPSRLQVHDGEGLVAQPINAQPRPTPLTTAPVATPQAKPVAAPPATQQRSLTSSPTTPPPQRPATTAPASTTQPRQPSTTAPAATQPKSVTSTTAPATTTTGPTRPSTTESKSLPPSSPGTATPRRATPSTGNKTVATPRRSSQGALQATPRNQNLETQSSSVPKSVTTEK